MIPLFVELCAGTAALSLRLHKDGARPPVSRMGAKTGYADAILRVLGLYPGQRAERYLWCEPDPGVRLLLHAYRDSELAKAAAAIIRGWKDEDPRALWERLRAEGPPRLPDEGAGGVARWAIGQKWTHPGREPFAAFNDVVALGRAFTDRHGVGGVWVPQTPDKIGAWFDAVPGDIPALIHPDARTIDPPALPPGTVVFCDPPYQNTTGYAHDLPRPEVVTLAHRWASAGATVCISEAEPIPELVAEGWHAVRIDGERRGQKRTFSRQQAEWLTINRPPAWVPPVQVSLFG